MTQPHNPKKNPPSDRKVVSRWLFCTFFLFIFANPSRSQKVGLVLSGGGASGLAHIGVIKALEENHIPIDYITGTSMGAFIGALYAAGYTPQQMEELALSSDFKDIATGTIKSRYIYFFRQKQDEASWVTFRFAFDSSLISSIPTHLISPVPIDFALLKYFTAASFAARSNFDSLFVPFRCVAADIVNKKPFVFKGGNLGEAVRASISYPFYLKPVIVDGNMLFDGGLYNNFPADVMEQEFHPDIVLGSNVASKLEPPSEDNILSQIRNMLMTPTQFKLEGNGAIIVPDVEAGVLTANHPKALIDSGYSATMRQMPEILKLVSRRIDSAQLNSRRKMFLVKQQPLVFGSVTTTGLNKARDRYIKSILEGHKPLLTLNEMERNYYKVATDYDIRSIYPVASHLDSLGHYTLNADVRNEKPFSASFGGVISNRPISTGYVGVQYHHTGAENIDLAGNSYFGELYTSGLVSAKISLASPFPIYIEPALVYNRWNYFTSSTEFFQDVIPPYLVQEDEYGKFDIGIPVGMEAKMTFGASSSNYINSYYPNVTFKPTDTADQTKFEATAFYIRYELNTLNRKEYASAGTRIFFQAQNIQGWEDYLPGTQEVNRLPGSNYHQMEQLKLSIDNYYKQRGLIRLGIFAEGVYTYSLLPAGRTPLETYFTNYNATVLMAPAFQPTPESQVLFLPDYRAYNYAAGGPKLIISFKPNIDLRFEGYIFLPYQAIDKTTNNGVAYGTPLANRYYVGAASVVYNSPIGPISLSLNYFENSNPINNFSILFHIGFIIFNEKSL